jgi:hypothetical protein
LANASRLVIAGLVVLVPAISLRRARCLLIEIAGTSPAMTKEREAD